MKEERRKEKYDLSPNGFDYQLKKIKENRSRRRFDRQGRKMEWKHRKRKYERKIYKRKKKRKQNENISRFAWIKKRKWNENWVDSKIIERKMKWSLNKKENDEKRKMDWKKKRSRNFLSKIWTVHVSAGSIRISKYFQFKNAVQRKVFRKNLVYCVFDRRTIKNKKRRWKPIIFEM